MKTFDRLKMAFQVATNSKALTEVRHPGGNQPRFLLNEAPLEREMKQRIGTATSANIVMSPIRYIQRAAAETEPSILNANGEPVDHPAAALFERPNPFYSFWHLIAALIFSYSTSGNAYVLIERDRIGNPKELWYWPHWKIQPTFKPGSTEFLSGYKYKPQNEWIDLDPEDVLHFRNGIDPEQMRLGLSPLAGLIAEIWGDMEAGTYVSALLKNNGVPGIVFAPRGQGEFDEDDLEDIKAELQAQTTGANRGGAVAFSGDFRLEQYGFDPTSLDLSGTRNTYEERVCAALGIPAAVVGFGTGVQQTKVGATLKELKKEAYTGGVKPILSNFAAEFDRGLIQMWPSRNARGEYFVFDDTNHPAMVEDQKAREQRIADRVKNGIITVNEARTALGEEPAPDGDIYLRPFSIIEVPAGSSGRMITDEGKAGTKGHDHTFLEERIAENAPRLNNPPPALIELARQIDIIRVKSAEGFAKALENFFEDLGRKAERVAREVLNDGKGHATPFFTVKAVNGGGPVLIRKNEELDAARIHEGMGMADELPIFEEIFEKHYFGMGEAVAGSMSAAFSIEAGVPDTVARSILATAGRRAGLIDIDKQAKEVLFKVLVEAEAEGLGADAIARRIRDKIPAGPWSTASIRAKVIARTEAMFATNISAIELGKEMGAEQAVVFDARKGDTDEICEALAGAIVSLPEARQLTDDEHPNGTRSFTPLPPGFEL